MVDMRFVSIFTIQIEVPSVQNDPKNDPKNLQKEDQKLWGNKVGKQMFFARKNLPKWGQKWKEKGTKKNKEKSEKREGEYSQLSE